MIGPGVILVATALGSGEYVIWPFVAANLGLTVLWAAIVAVAIQFFINMEVERYTLATGETAITGFTRMWKPWWFLFVLMAIVPNVWPGLAIGRRDVPVASSSATSTSRLVAVLGLLAIGVTLTASPVVYRTVEKLQTVIIAGVVVWLVIAVVAGTRPTRGATSSAGFGELRLDPVRRGRGGHGRGDRGRDRVRRLRRVRHLAVSNWVRDQGMRMGHYVPRIASPLSGEQEAVPSTGSAFRAHRREPARAGSGWWKVANTEQAVTFWLIGTAGIVILSVLAYSTLFGQDTGEDFDFIQKEGEVLKDVVAPWFGTRVLDGGLLQAAVHHARQLRLRQPHHGRRGEDQRDAGQPVLDREPDLRRDGVAARRSSAS